MVAAAVLFAAVASAAVILDRGSAAEIATTPGPVLPATGSGFPSPPPGATVFSRQFGANALALAVVPQGEDLALQASVVGPQGKGVSGLAVAFDVDGATATGADCGAGCYQATVPVSGRPEGVRVDVSGPTRTSWPVALPGAWPPPDASGLIAGAGRTWRSLGSMSFTSRLASDARHAATSVWRVQAPDRAAYQVLGGWAGVIIADHRWDRAPGGKRWAKSAQSPITQPTPVWSSAVDAHLLGTSTRNGRPTALVSFFDPDTPAWFTVVLDRKTLRTLDLHMVTTSHFMHETYVKFNATPAIHPPR